MNYVIVALVAFGLLAWGGRRPAVLRRWIRAMRSGVQAFQRGASPSITTVNERDARALLGVDAKADRAAIEAAYRKLMQSAHPDHGGSADLAAKLNAARDLLLGS